jgi:hypothetical protein
MRLYAVLRSRGSDCLKVIRSGYVRRINAISVLKSGERALSRVRSSARKSARVNC